MTVTLGRFLRLPDVARETSLSRTAIYNEIATGRFPPPIRLTANRVAWLETDIERWKSDQIAACRKEPILLQ